MKNLIAPEDDTVSVVAPVGGVVSGMAYAIGSLFGVATNDAAAGAVFALRRRGQVWLPKATGAGTDFAVGAELEWDAGNSRVAAKAAGALRALVVTKPATTDARVHVVLV